MATPAWIEQLLFASFRGVEFQVDSIDVSGGNNLVVREYPFQDLPTVFSMGQAAEELKFSAYVIGGDYTDQRDRLREALDAAGDGVLIHPTAGSIRAFVAGKYTIKEQPTAEGGLARFDLTFLRAEERRYPVGRADSSQNATEAAEDAKDASTDAFASQWTLADKPGWVADRAVDRLKGALDAVWAPLSAATKELGDFTHMIIGNYQALRTGLNDLVRTPRLLADAIATLFELPADLQRAAARDFQSAFSWVFELDRRLTRNDFVVSIMPPVGGGLVIYGAGNAAALAAIDGGSDVVNSTARAQLAQLTAASDQLIETLATAAYVQAVSAMVADDEGSALPLGRATAKGSTATSARSGALSGSSAARQAALSYDDVLAMREAVHTQVSRLLMEASSAAPAATMPATSWHVSVMAMHTAALAVLQTRSGTLARLSSYTPEAWQSVWTISHKLYGTVTYADEIMALNPQLRHPVLVPPGKALRVMRHD